MLALPTTAKGRRRYLPLLLLSVLAVGGAFLPGGRIVGNDFIWGLAWLGGAGVFGVVAWRTDRRVPQLAAAVCYLGFVVSVILAEGDITAGAFSLALIPVLWISLYGTGLDSVLIVSATIAAVVALSGRSHAPSDVTVRSAVLWGCVAVGLSLAIHHLRDRYEATLAARDQVVRETELLSGAVRQLTALHTPDEVIRASVRLAAQLCSPGGPDGRRALYLVVEGDHARIAAEVDESGHRGPDSNTPNMTILLADHPPLAQVVATHKPVLSSLEPATLGPSARSLSEAMNLSHGAAAPVLLGDTLHGVLAVGGRGGPVREFRRLVDLADILALALANAEAHESLEEQATTDPLTGCANRRGLLFASKLLPSREPFSVVAADLDGLKQLNDRLGHEAGDAALIRFARLVQAQLRGGDVLARVGGDEFIILMHSAGPANASHLSERILVATQASHAPVSVSLGIAWDTNPGRFDDTWQRADRAMYQAKRAGGMRWVPAAAPGIAS